MTHSVSYFGKFHRVTFKSDSEPGLGMFTLLCPLSKIAQIFSTNAVFTEIVTLNILVYASRCLSLFLVASHLTNSDL